MVVLNADQLNTTHNLSVFHDDVLQPKSSDTEDVKAWLEERIQDQIEGAIQRPAGRRRWGDPAQSARS